MKKLCLLIGLFVLGILAHPAHVSAQSVARVVVNATAAPVFVKPDAKTTPLRLAKEGSVLNVVAGEGEWYRVEFNDPQFGRRVGYIEKRHVSVQVAAHQQAIDLTVAESRPAQNGFQTQQRQPVAQATGGAFQFSRFRDAKLQIQQGDEQKQIQSSLAYESDSLVIAPYDKKLGARSLKYADITSAEYTFGKSPRIAAALLVSPLFLFNSSKSHWLTVKTGDDYALLRLDKSNYKLVIAELEKRAHITVASVGENK